MSHGSQQLRMFRRALHIDGAQLAEAAALAGMSLIEAKLWAADDAKNPPPPEAFELLNTPSSTDEKEASMARKSSKSDATPADNGGVYNAPNAKDAIRIYRNEIAPRKAFISEKQGDLSDPYSRIKDECHFPRKVLDLLFFLEGCEDAKRDHMLTALHAGLTEMNFKRPMDLVALSEGDGAAKDVVPAAAAKPRSRMATIPSDGIDADLAAAADVEPSNLQLN